MIHNAIKQQINNHKVNRSVDKELAKEFFINALNDAKINKEKIIAECANGFNISEDKFENIEIDGIEQIENFFNSIWPNYSKLECLGNEISSTNFSVGDIPALVKCDFLAENNGTYVLTDWKTGNEGYENAKDSNQINAYIMWVHKEYGVSLENIIGELVYLKTGTTDTTKKTQEEINEFIEVVDKNSKEMLSVKDENDFDPTLSKNCMGCNYLTLCQDGQKFMENGKI